MFYAIASAVNRTLNSWGQTESSYFWHLWQAGVELRHLAAGEPCRKPVESPVEMLLAGPSLWTCRSLWGHKYPWHCSRLALFIALKGESAEGKAIKNYQTQRHQQLHCKVGWVPEKLCGMPPSSNPPQASADGYCPTAGGRTTGWTNCLSMRALSDFSHHDPDSGVERHLNGN